MSRCVCTLLSVCCWLSKLNINSSSSSFFVLSCRRRAWTNILEETCMCACRNKVRTALSRSFIQTKRSSNHFWLTLFSYRGVEGEQSFYEGLILRVLLFIDIGFLHLLWEEQPAGCSRSFSSACCFNLRMYISISLIHETWPARQFSLSLSRSHLIIHQFRIVTRKQGRPNVQTFAPSKQSADVFG